MIGDGWCGSCNCTAARQRDAAELLARLAERAFQGGEVELGCSLSEQAEFALGRALRLERGSEGHDGDSHGEWLRARKALRRRRRLAGVSS